MADADHLYAADYRWWAVHIGDVARDFDGTLWTCETPSGGNWGDKDPAKWGITCLTVDTHAPGLSSKQGFIHGGGNSGYQGINLAHLLGATTILLLGFDMQGDSHWFGKHPRTLNQCQDFGTYAHRFNSIGPDYGVINCSRATALTCFPRMTIDEFRCSA